MNSSVVRSGAGSIGRGRSRISFLGVMVILGVVQGVGAQPTTAPTICEEPGPDVKLKFKENGEKNCEEIAAQGFCGSVEVDDQDNFLEKAKFTCVVSCGLCAEPSQPPTPVISEEPTGEPSQRPTPVISEEPTLCEDLIPPDEKLKFKENGEKTCEEIAAQDFCGSVEVDDQGNFLEKAKFTCLRSCGICISTPAPAPTTPSPTVCEDLSPTVTNKNGEVVTCATKAGNGNCKKKNYDGNGNVIGIVSDFCRKTCGLCVSTPIPAPTPEPTTEPTPSPTVCEDLSPEVINGNGKVKLCTFLASKGRCNKSIFDDNGNKIGIASDVCRKSCDVCT